MYIPMVLNDGDIFSGFLLSFAQASSFRQGSIFGLLKPCFSNAQAWLAYSILLAYNIPLNAADKIFMIGR
jgi:hypothetical protein